MKFNGVLSFLVVAACYYMPTTTTSACPCSDSIKGETKSINRPGLKHTTDAETRKNRRNDLMQELGITLKKVNRLFNKIKRKAIRKEKNCKNYSIIGQVDSKNINRTFQQLVNLTIYTRDLFHVNDLSLTPLLCDYELTMDNPVSCPVTTFGDMAQATLLGLDKSEENDYKFWSLCDIKKFLKELKKTLTKVTTTKVLKDKPENGKGKHSEKVGGKGGKAKRKRLGKKGKKSNRTSV